MLVLLCQTRDLRDLSLCDLIRIDTADAFSLRMDLQHDPSRRRPIQREDLLEHLNDEFHRSVIVIQQYYAIKRWALQPRLGLLGYQAMALAPVEPCVLVRHPDGNSIGADRSIEEQIGGSDSATLQTEGNCVLLDTISKFSYLLRIVLLPYDGQLSVS